MEEKNKYLVPTPNKGDVAYTLSRIFAAILPGPASAIFDTLLKAPIESRKEEWMKRIAEGLRKLEEDRPEFKAIQLGTNNSTKRGQASTLDISRFV